MSGNCLVFYRLVLSVYGEFPSLDDQKHIFLLSRNNCQWRFPSLGQIVWLVVMLLFLCMPVDGVLIHRAVAFTYHAISVVNWNTNIDSIVHAVSIVLLAD